MGLNLRKAIYKHFAQGIPSVYTIDKENCIRIKKGAGKKKKPCGLCEKVCPADAVNFNQEDELVEIDAGAIILATGYDLFDPSGLSNYGYGRIKNVVVSLECERLMSASGPTGGHLERPSDGRLAKRVGFIQCVGSRDLRNRDYCSGFCCMHSIKEAILTREHDAESEVYIFYNDLRAMGKGFHEYRKRGENQYGIKYIKARVGEITQDEEENPIVWYEDIKEGKVKHLTLDMAVLATASVPSEGGKELTTVLGVDLDEHGFVRSEMIHPLSTSVPGIFLCGACQGPIDIPESVTQASGAAAFAAEIMQAANVKEY
jgi:heterodisulfide reductase subunit A